MVREQSCKYCYFKKTCELKECAKKCKYYLLDQTIIAAFETIEYVQTTMSNMLPGEPNDNCENDLEPEAG